jgi:thioredoxin-like negative regulator of GroEL
MSSGIKAVIIVVLVAAAGGLRIYKKNQKADNAAAGGDIPPQGACCPGHAVELAKTPLPKLVDLGKGTCIPCKAMKPILEDLTANYSGTFETVFIDVGTNKDAGDQYNINLIPTQIFFDADGKELFRHEGFYSKEDILAKWKELGVEATAQEQQAAN